MKESNTYHVRVYYEVSFDTKVEADTEQDAKCKAIHEAIENQEKANIVPDSTNVEVHTD